MTPRPGPVRLTREDWRVIYVAFVEASPPSDSASHRVLRRIGFMGETARDRGVARVKRGKTKRGKT